MATRALLVGRFQPPHWGHARALAACARRYEALFVGVGSSQASHTADNPFTAGERFELLLGLARALRLRNLHLFPLPDIHRHGRWVRHVESLVPPFDVVVTHNPLTARLFRAAGYRIEPGRLWNRDDWSAREVRRRVRAGQPVDDLVPPAVRAGLEAFEGWARIRTTGSPRHAR